MSLKMKNSRKRKPIVESVTKNDKNIVEESEKDTSEVSNSKNRTNFVTKVFVNSLN